jgi:uncharacterized protein YjbI with pentapeptide repeats
MTNTRSEKMKPKNVIVWILLLGIVVLLMSTSAQANDEVNANAILEKIENGEGVYLENVHIVGELNLSEIELKTIPNRRSEWEIYFYDLEEELKIVESEIEIRDSVFEDDVDFSNTQFRKDIYVYRTSFLGEVDFRGVDFAGDANFWDANFAGAANFWDANFAGAANFEDANFTGPTNFVYANFAGPANFKDANFAGAAGFEYANFAGPAGFLYANFTGPTDFEYANFAGPAGFWDANFAGYAGFNYTEFDKVFFTGTLFTKVSLVESNFNQMKVKWRSLKDVLVFDGSTYIKLIKNFREMEQFEEADAAYYQYRQLSQKNKKWSLSKLMDVVAGASCGYGVKPGFALIWAFVLIMVFALVYWLGDGIKRLKEKNGDKNRVSRWAAFYNAFYFSVVTFTTVGYGDWYPEDRYRIVVMVEGVLGWLLLALFIVTLANVMIRP